MDGIVFHSHNLTNCITTGKVSNSPENWLHLYELWGWGRGDSSYASHPVSRSLTKCMACI